MGSREQELEEQLKQMKEERRQRDEEWRRGVTAGMEHVTVQLGEIHQTLHSVRESWRNKASEIDKHEKILTGGARPEEGMIFRLGDVERAHKSNSRVLWICTAALLTGAITFIFDTVRTLFSKIGHP